MRISVILPTVRPWPEVKAALTSCLAQDTAEPFEILVMDGHGSGLPAAPEPPVRWLRVPGADVFHLRARGVAAARGEIVVISEDHCLAPPCWLARTSAAHRARTAAVLVGPVRNHVDSTHSVVDRANFALTLGPFAPPLAHVPAWRLPVPTNVSMKRAFLGTIPRPDGWLEYDMLADAMRQGCLDVAGDAVLDHLQHWHPAEAVAVHFQSGRSYGASVRRWPAADRRAGWRSLTRLPGRLYRRTAPTMAGSPAGDRAWLAALILANTLGQATGVLRGAGESRRRLV
jgi:hypothetical protein